MTDQQSPSRLPSDPTYLIAVAGSAIAFLIAIILTVPPSAIHHKLLQLAVSGFSSDGIVTSEGIATFNKVSIKIAMLATLMGGIFLGYAFIWRYISCRLPIDPPTKWPSLTSQSQPISPLEIYSFLTITIIGLILRLRNITRGLHHDELNTVMRFADVDSVWKTVSSDHIFNNHVANSILTHFSLLIFGRDEWALRLPSLLIGLITLFYFWLFTRKLVRPEVSLVAGFILAVSPMHIFYSTSVRGYTGAILFTLISAYLYFELLHRQSYRILIFFIASSIAAIYFHLYSILVAGIYLLFLLHLAWTQMHRRPLFYILSRGSFNRISVSLGSLLIISLILYSPILPQWVQNFSNVKHGSFQLFFPLRLINEFSGMPGNILLVGVFIMFSLGLVSLRSLHPLETKYFMLLFLASFLVPWLSRHKFLAPRFVIFLLPYYILCVAAGFFSLWHMVADRRRKISGYILRGMCLLMALSVLWAWSINSWSAFVGGGYSAAARAIEDHEPQSFGLCAVGWWARPISYYLPQQIFVPRSMEEFEQFVGSYPAIKCVDGAPGHHTAAEPAYFGDIRQFLAREAQSQEFNDIIVFTYPPSR
jgi:Dolichyl-phosphate-mannose-protein mannosyltransferase